MQKLDKNELLLEVEDILRDKGVLIGLLELRKTQGSRVGMYVRIEFGAYMTVFHDISLRTSEWPAQGSIMYRDDEFYAMSEEEVVGLT